MHIQHVKMNGMRIQSFKIISAVICVLFYSEVNRIVGYLKTSTSFLFVKERNGISLEG